MIQAIQYSLIGLNIATLVFHFCILLKVIPYSIVWGGRLKSLKDMYRFEIVSILINLLILFIVLVHSNFIDLTLNGTLMTSILWALMGIFLLNTFGNLASKNKLEKIIFTPITLLSSIAFGYLAWYN